MAGSVLVFLFALAVLINHAVGTLLVSLEDDLVAGIERENGIRIAYDSISIASLDTLVMNGLKIRHADTNRQAILASLDRAEVQVRLIPLIFGGKDVMESISSLVFDNPSINLYSDGSLFDSFREAAVRRETNTSAKPGKKFDVDVVIRNGMVRVYGSDSIQAVPPAAPLAEVSLHNLDLELRENKGSFSIKSELAMLPSQDLVAGKLEVAGILDLDTGSVDALVTASGSRVAGFVLPELRFFVSREAGQVTVDSSTFGQPVSIDGRWREGAEGSFVLTLDRNLRSFDSFMTRTASSVLGRMFFSKDDQYSPTGKVVVDIGSEGVRMSGDLAIEDRNGRPVFRFAAGGNSQILTVDRFELARDEHLISLSGYWDWKGFPHFAARVRKFELEGATIDGNCTVRPAADGMVALDLEGLALNGRHIGSVSALMNPGASKISFDGFSGTLRGHAALGAESAAVQLDLSGFQLGDLVEALTGAGFVSGWSMSGPLVVSRGTNGISLRGETTVVTAGQGNIVSAFKYNGEELRIDRFESDWLSLTGAVRREYDGASGKFLIDYNGRRWPLTTQIKQTGDIARVGVEITGMLAGQADISGNEVRASLSLSGIDLAPFGVNGILKGEGTLVRRGGAVLTGGTFSLRMQDPGIPSAALVFHGADRRFDVTSIVLEREGHAFSGGGTVWFDEQDSVHCSLAFANGLALQANTIPGGVVVQSQFDNLDLAGVFPGIMAGVLQGRAEVRLVGEVPAASWNIRLSKGTLQGLQVSIVSEAKSRPGGFQLEKTSLVFGDAELSVRNGYLVQTAGGLDFMCNGTFVWGGAPFRVDGRILAQGGTSSGQAEAVVALSGVRFGNSRVTDFSSAIMNRGGRLDIRKTGPAGLDGWYDLAANRMNLRYSDSSGMSLLVQGKNGKQLDLTAHAVGLPLSVLQNYPVVFRSAEGRANLSISLRGPAERPEVSGLARIENARMDLSMLRSPLTRLALQASVTQGTITLGYLTATNGSGSLSVRGKAFIRNGEVDDIDVRLQTDRKHGLDLDLVDPEIRSSGGALADLFITGNINAPHVQGRVALHDNEFFYMEDSAIPSKENWIKRIRWNLEVAVLDGVSYVNQLVTAMIQPGSSLHLKNSIIDKDFLVSGRVTASRGTFDYINHEFRIEQPTYIEFRRTSFGLDPWLAFRGRLRLKDEELENVDIYLTFAGPLSTGINPVFSAEPERSQDEIRVLLGIEQPDTTSADGRRKNENIMLRSTELISLLGLKPLTKEIREWFGLDIFTIRTPIVRNILERESLDALDPKRQLSIFRDTQFSLGKYLTSFMFVEYTLVLKDDLQSFGDVLPTHQVGLELSFDFLNLGYLIKPTEKSGFGEYEQSIELRFRQRF